MQGTNVKKTDKIICDKFNSVRSIHVPFMLYRHLTCVVIQHRAQSETWNVLMCIRKRTGEVTCKWGSGELLDKLRNCQLIRKDSAPWN